MRNWLLKIFAVTLAVIVGSGAAFATGRPMTSPEQDAFVAELQKWIDDYATKKYESIRAGFSSKDLEAEVVSDIVSWGGHSSLFRELNHLGSGKPWEDADRTDICTFAEALGKYHDRIAKGMPLCCRGFASYVFEELRNRGIDCHYAKVSFNPMINNPAYIDAMLGLRKLKKTPENIEKIKKAISKRRTSECRDVVIYRTDMGEFVCDFMQAVITSLRYRYCRKDIQSEMKFINCGYTDMMRFARVPLVEYIRFYVDHCAGMVCFSPDFSYGGVVDNPFQILDLDAHPELLAKRECEVYDHFRKLEDYELAMLLENYVKN